MQEPPGKRTLEEDIPELKQFLKTGANVLDVGCGTGTITLGVAEAVKPGEVVGIDRGKDRVDVAREWAAQNPQTKNITYQVGDSHQLDFPDNTFDVVYSHTVMHFFLDPIMGLKEQKRVTKPGGWVIASGVRDHVSLRHPHCPNWEKLCEAYRRYLIVRLEEYRASGKVPVEFFEKQYKIDPNYAFYWDLHAGRKCVEWFYKAGLVDVRIEIQPRSVRYQGLEGLKPGPLDLLVFDEPELEGWGEYQSWQARVRFDHLRMIAMGLLDEETLERAVEEARAWYKDPGAFMFWPQVFATGRVK